MSVENLRVDEPASKGWANLFMNNLTVYNGLKVGGKTTFTELELASLTVTGDTLLHDTEVDGDVRIRGNLELDGDFNFAGGRGVAVRDVTN